jgi:hypothetical protein
MDRPLGALVLGWRGAGEGAPSADRVGFLAVGSAGCRRRRMPAVWVVVGRRSEGRLGAPLSGGPPVGRVGCPCWLPPCRSLRQLLGRCRGGALGRVLVAGDAASLPDGHRWVRGRWTWGSPALQPMPGQPTTARPLALDLVGVGPRPAGGGVGDGGEGPSAGVVGSFGPAGNWAAWLRLAARLVLGSSVEGGTDVWLPTLRQ